MNLSKERNYSLCFFHYCKGQVLAFVNVLPSSGDFGDLWWFIEGHLDHTDRSIMRGFPVQIVFCFGPLGPRHGTVSSFSIPFSL